MPTKKIFKSFGDLAQSGELAPEDNENVKGGPGKQSRRLAKFWLEQIDQVDSVNKDWHQRGDAIIKRFRDERGQAAAKERRLNVLWSNIKVLLPALYGKPPIPFVERKFLQKDPVGRTSSVILERTVINDLENNGMHLAVKRSVLDLLLAGRGSVWVRYEPEIGQGDSIPAQAEGSFDDDLEDIEGNEESDEEEKLEATEEQIISEQIPVDYLHWKDLYLFPATARVWDEIQAVGKRIYISREEAIQRFGEEVGKELQFENTTINREKRLPFSNASLFKSNKDKSIEIFEIWNKVDTSVYWVSTGYDYLCDKKKDPLKLKKFFPIPEVISSTLTNESMVPVPDYIEYQDQALQIDELTRRLAMLTKACKVAGCYDGSNGSLKRLFQEGFENDLIPVDAWAAFAEKGGVEGGIALLPIDKIQQVIETLTKVRQQLMMDLDLITGISDVIRGTTDSRETLGGIRLKNNNAGTRLSERQNEIATFVKNTIEIIAEIAAKHYSDNKLIESSGILYDEDMQIENILEELNSQFEEQGNNQNQQQQQNALPAPPDNINNLMPGPQGLNNQAQQGNFNNVIPFPNIPQPNSPFPQQQPQQSPQQLQPQQFQFTEQDAVEEIINRIQEAIKLLRSDVPRGYRIDIETDSTLFGDAAQEREDAVLFIKEVSGFLQGATKLGAELPEAVPPMGRMLLWAVRKFRVGRDLEGALNDFVKKVDKRVKQQLKNPKPNPEEQKAQIEMQKMQAEIQQQREKHQHEMQAQQANDQRDFQKQQAEDQREAALAQMKLENERETNKMKMELEQLKAQIEMMKLKQEQEFMIAQHQVKMREVNMNMVQNQQQHQQTMEQNEQQADLADQQHQHNIKQTELKNQQAKTQHTQKMEQMKIQSQEKDKARKDKAKSKNKGQAA